ncbi:fimbrial biogenesis chaperone [Luteimonas fraxinea]|uniref:Fimbria/pilus periplasmic chaperone n=1 Tax=Luteimonas fraxinea TaxID=2901869 RepID=A0ABS8UCS2_9GAMM|nr:fimbria/pilus periplasmic chaperone [Luteimonas fraxinea]MCD9096677.1 fimbria/pilus periplasmic chaperone [Luteimonas fraxinea]MCD9126047.1 fimbria/pilus periplasmic chaperone [Luteimonas fraxinea]
MHRLILAASLALLMTSAFAANVAISPTTLEAHVDAPAQAIALHNRGDVPLRYQVRAYHWSQANGEDVLTESADVLATPAIVEVPAKGRRVVRLMRLEGVGTIGYYRVLVHQLPALNDADAKASNVSLLVHHSIPMAFEPRAAGVSLMVGPAISGYRFHNAGTTAARLTRVGPATGQPWREGALGWVLPGMSKAIPLEATDRAPTVSVTVNGDVQTLTVGP